MDDLMTVLFHIDTDDQSISQLQRKFQKMKKEVKTTAKGLSKRTEEEVLEMGRAIYQINAQLNERYVEEVKRGGDYGAY